MVYVFESFECTKCWLVVIGTGAKAPSSALLCDWNFGLMVAKKYPRSQEQGFLGTQKKGGGRVSVFLFFFWWCFFLRKSQFFDVSQGNSCESHKWDMGNFLVGSGCSDTSLAVSQI